LAASLQHLQSRLRLTDPSKQLTRSINFVIVVLIIANVVAIILESVESIGLAYRREFVLFEIFSVVVFSVEYIVRITCCPPPGASGSEALSARMKYVLSVHGLIDLLAIAPFYLSMFTGADLRFLRALRLIRILKLTRYSPAMTMLYRSIGRERHAITAAMCLLAIALVVTSCGIYFCERAAQPEAFGSIPAAIWWAVATLTTVGYGDVTPITVGGKMFGALVMILGVGLVALPTAILASTFADEMRRRREEFTAVADVALEDGILSGAELDELESLRARNGLSDEDAERILHHLSAARRQSTERCPNCGHERA